MTEQAESPETSANSDRLEQSAVDGDLPEAVAPESDLQVDSKGKQTAESAQISRELLAGDDVTTTRPEETGTRKAVAVSTVVADGASNAPDKDGSDAGNGGADQTGELANRVESEEPKEDFATLLDASSGVKHTQEVVVGEKISGVLSQIKGDHSFVDFGGRSEGMIKTSELKNDDGSMIFDTGEPLEAFVMAAGDEIVLSRFLHKDQRQADILYQAYKSGMPIEGTVTAVNKWGLGVEVQGMRAFCPISQIDTQFVESTEKYRGETLQFRIIRFKDHGLNIVLSRRALLQAEVNKAADGVRAQLVEGARVQGKVTRLESFGAFVDLGSGVEGLVHVSELRHERVSHPKEVVGEGVELTVAVLGTKNLGDHKKERISLSIKALEEDPWDQNRQQFQEGAVVQGMVEAIENYGAFVELAPNVRGLVHVSELSARRVNHPRDVISIGDRVKVVVLQVDSRRRRLRLSMKQAEKMESASDLEEFQKRQIEEEAEKQTAGSALADALMRAGLG